MKANAKHVLPILSAVASLLLCACPSGGSGDSGTPFMPLDECEGVAPVKLIALPSTVRVGGASQLIPSGGTGRYKYELAMGGPGSVLSTDRLIASKTPGKEKLTVSDDCGNQATQEITIVASFTVAPTLATVALNKSFQVSVVGALGEVKFTPLSLGSGGSVSTSGRYTSGGTPGVDLISVKDLATADEVLLQYTVSATARFQGRSPNLAVPAGASIPLETVDGTGKVKWNLSGPGRLNDAGGFETDAGESGLATLTATDLFTSETATVKVRVLDELTRAMRPHGRLSDFATLATGDFDGDGISDVALGVPESDLGRPTGGAVFVFKGNGTGLPNKPTWILTGESDTAALGTVLAAGDLDGDGRADLAVSAPGADLTINDSGAVYLYKFTAEGPVPLRAPLTGLGRGNFGASLAIADADGDGDNDLIVGSPGGDLAPSAQISQRGIVDVFLLQKGAQIPDLGAIRLGGADLSADGGVRPATGLRFGRSLAVADFNGDGRNDIATVGQVNNSLTNGAPLTRVQAAIAVHLGRAMTPAFADTPDVYVLPLNAGDSDEGVWRIGAVPAPKNSPALLIAAADRLDYAEPLPDGGTTLRSNAGGAHLYDLRGFTASGLPSLTPPQVGRTNAAARFFGDAAGVAAGRSFAIADVDADGVQDLVLGAPNATATVPMGTGTVQLTLAGKLLAYPFANLAQGAQTNKPSQVRAGAAKAELLGVAVAAWTVQGKLGLVAFSSRASNASSDFTGRLDGFLGAGALATWGVTSAELPAKSASQQFGSAVEVGVVDGKVRAAVGMPGYSGPGVSGDGNDLNAGQALVYDVAMPRNPVLQATGAGTPYLDNGKPAFGGRTLGVDVAMTDFDGDGREDVVVAAPGFSTPLPANNEYAVKRPECMPAASQTNGGAFVHLARPDGTFKEGFRLWATLDIAGCTVPDGGSVNVCRRSNLSRTGMVGRFDFNGDGKKDLLLTRSNGLELFLGRAPDDASLAQPSMGCDPAFSLPFLTQPLSSLNALGDLDGDGCDEVSARYNDTTRSGLLVLFGFDSGGVRCGGKTAASWVRISGDPETGLNNMQLGISAARAGKLFGDAKDYLAVSANLYPLQGIAQPTVLLYDVAELVARRPATGGAVVSALNDGLEPIPMRYVDRAVGFGARLWGNVDLTGDGKVDLVVSAPGASVNGDGTGAVFVFEGGRPFQTAERAWLTLVGDGAERGLVGADLSVAAGLGPVKPQLLVGAPLSYRSGTANGTAWVLPFSF